MIILLSSREKDIKQLDRFIANINYERKSFQMKYIQHISIAAWFIAF
jgi:hypothetical protein